MGKATDLVMAKLAEKEAEGIGAFGYYEPMRDLLLTIAGEIDAAGAAPSTVQPSPNLTMPPIGGVSSSMGSIAPAMAGTVSVNAAGPVEPPASEAAAAEK